MARVLAIYLPDLSGGGVERMRLNLIPHFQKAGYEIDILLNKTKGPLLDRVPDLVRVINLDASRTAYAIPKLIRYLRQRQPDVFLSALPHNNLAACIAKRMSRVKTRLIVSLHNTLSEEVRHGSIVYKILPHLLRHALPFADKIVAVSEGVANDLASCIKINRDRITTIYNPVITENFIERMTAPVEHPWFKDNNLPVVVAAGRLSPQKDFKILIHAFSLLLPHTPSRLLILGEGEERAALLALAKQLGVTEHVHLAGYIQNPIPYFREATLLVMSSRYEGLGNVLVEALACGTPVISTDCPYGPAEICQNLPYEALCPVGNAAQMAERIRTCLLMPHDREGLRSHAQKFMAAHAAEQYLAEN